MENYRTCREKAHMSLSAAAQALRVGEVTLRSYERGDTKPDALTIRHMAVIYNCSSDELLGIKKKDCTCE